jgi:hypothetical protein
VRFSNHSFEDEVCCIAYLVEQAAFRIDNHDLSGVVPDWDIVYTIAAVAEPLLSITRD